MWWVWVSHNRLEKNGRRILGIKSTDFSDGLAVGSRGEGVLKDDMQVSGIYSQWMVVPLVEIGKNRRLPCWGDWNILI